MRRLLTPGWLALHVVAIVLVLAFLRLGWWQWERATSTGSAQSYGYAIQWPFFALFVIFMWVKMVRDDLSPDRPAPGAEPAADPAGDAVRRDEGVPASPVDDEEDEEFAAYNRYLAGLNSRAGQRR